MSERRERLATLPVAEAGPRPRRTAESIAGEAYRSSRIEGCRVDYERLVESVRDLQANTEQG